MTTKTTINTTDRVTLWIAALLLAVVASSAFGGTVRIWPDAVVVNDSITVGDLCRIDGFDSEIADTIRSAEVTASPVPGGSAEVKINDVRKALRAAGVNMASVVVRGSSRCAVMRPRDAVSTPKTPVKNKTADTNTTDGKTLRDAVTAYFTKEIGRTDGRVDVLFGRTAEQVLDLSSPEFTFQIIRRSPRPLGLVSLDVTIKRDGRNVRTIPMALTVQYTTEVLVAARAINAKAEVREEDLRYTEMSFDQLATLPMTDLNRAVGQCARKFIPPGTPIQLRSLEPVPIVRRGDTVEIISRAGGITIVTSGKALQSGAYGESITLRTTNSKLRRQTIAATVIGPSQVEVREIGNANTIQFAGGVQ